MIAVAPCLTVPLETMEGVILESTRTKESRGVAFSLILTEGHYVDYDKVDLKTREHLRSLAKERQVR